MLPEPRTPTPCPDQSPPLPHRTPGRTDLRMFTTEVLRSGRHRSSVWSRVRSFPLGGLSVPVRLTVLAFAAVVALPLSGCASSGTTSGVGGQSTNQAAAALGERVDLRGVCPSTVVVQSPWFPQVELASVYQLLGAGYRVDVNHKTVTGPLVAHGGVDTGVDIQIRSGGPSIGGQQVSAIMYQDKSITLGMNATDETVQNSIRQPTTAVFAPFDVDPLVLIWSPAAHPSWSGILDIGQTSTPVLFFEGERSYIDYLIGAGILRSSQVDGSYDGTPVRLVASRGQVVVQGFATSEPWKWQHEIPQWGKPLSYELVSDLGYPDYRDALVIRTGDKTRLAPCLRRLVPVLQQALVDFMTKPSPTTDVILSILDKYHTFYTDSPARSAYAVATMRGKGLVGDGSNHTIGDFDLTRIAKIIDIMGPIYASQRKPVAAGLSADRIATNEFLDPTIGLPTAR